MYDYRAGAGMTSEQPTAADNETGMDLYAHGAFANRLGWGKGAAAAGFNNENPLASGIQ
jgi:hypothetical protein